MVFVLNNPLHYQDPQVGKFGFGNHRFPASLFRFAQDDMSQLQKPPPRESGAG